MKKALSILKYFIGWPLSFVALFFVARLLIGKNNTLFQIHEFNVWFLLLSIGCFIAFFFLRALFWQKLLQQKGMKFSYKETAFTWGFSEFKRYIPGSIWSIISRSSAYEKQGSERKAILMGILQEAEFLTLSCGFLSLFSLNFLFYGFFTIPYAQLFINTFIAIYALITAVFLFHKKLFPKKNSIFSHFFPDDSFQNLWQLFMLMTGAFALFGLATYFAVSTVTTLYLLHIVPLVGFFVFSFLAGYLSFLAPMGLGVREGIVTAGLSKYMPLGNAALGSIFSRVIQIVSELFFLAICLIWTKVSFKKLRKIETFLLLHKYEVTTIFFVCIYILYFTLACFYRYNNFFTGRFDLGNMDQTVWNTIHGRLFQLTDPNGTNIISRLAFHADFMLILLSPMYLIWQDPRMLLLIQTVAIGVGGIFVYLIAKKLTQKNSIALAFSLSYLLYPAIEYANLYDFHAVTIAVPFFLASWYAILKKRFYIATLLLLFAATTKEEVWIITGFFGLYFLFWHKKYVLGSLLSIISFSLFYYLFWHAIPLAHGGDHFALSYYSDFGSTPGSVLKNIFLAPLKTISDIFGQRQLTFLWELFFPVAFLPFLGLPLLFFAGPDLGISILSQNEQLHSIYYHYGAIPTPFIFLAAIYGFVILQKRFPHFLKYFGFYLVIIPAFIATYAFGPLPGAQHPNVDMFISQLPYSMLIDNFLQSIPKRYSVAATNNVGSHLSHRQKIFTIPVGLKEADIVVFLLDDSYAQPSLSDQKEMAKELAADPEYVQLYQYKDFVVYKKKSVPTYYRTKQRGLLPLFKGN